MGFAEDRQQSGRGMELNRQQSGRKMRDDLRALSAPPTAMEQLPALPKKGAIGAARGVADYNTSSAPASQPGGIASPLTEQSREYFDQEVVMSVDGVIAVAVRRPKKIVMADANDEEVVMEFIE